VADGCIDGDYIDGSNRAADDDVDLRMDAVVEVPVAALAAPYDEGAEDRLLSRD
jgi:hypothetical protein